jgi:hypothetical protein
MKIIINIFLAMILFTACVPKSKNKHLRYQNIVILSDMSTRIRNPRFPQKDIEEIQKIVEYFKNECVKPGEKIGDKSRIIFSAFSERNATYIDIDEFKNLSDKQSFINSTGKYEKCGLEKKLDNFKKRVKYYYETIENQGLDLISILIEKIENEDIVKQDNMITDGIDTTFIHYENHIYVFTDGYLEYRLPQEQRNRQYYYGNSEIRKVRQFCIDQKVDVRTALEQDRTFCLPSCKTDKNKYINLHILETHERDKNIRFQTYNNEKGVRDNEILEAVWQKWAKESGFKSFVWKKY